MVEKLLKVADLCERFDVDRRTVYNWVHTGQLEVTRWSARGWRFTEAAVETFIIRRSMRTNPNRRGVA